ncbi:hypothetical protein NEUTE2DRAFT_71562, partial [Neurospora tetrasperma FGSC 2509]
YKAAVNENYINVLQYKVSDEVMFNMSNYTTGRLYGKLAPRFEGPFCIIKATSYIVELALLENIKVIYIINIFCIKLYVEGFPS